MAKFSQCLCTFHHYAISRQPRKYGLGPSEFEYLVGNGLYIVGI